MRISDWSSDVCSSDLGCAAATQEGGAQEAERPPCLAVLPGSRRGEVTKLLPVFAEVVRALATRHPGLSVVIPTVETVEDMVRAQVAAWPVPVAVVRCDEARDRKSVVTGKSVSVLVDLGCVRILNKKKK